MSDDDVVTIKDRGLRQLLAALSPSSIPNVKVGILGDKTARKAQEGSSTVSNAEIGAKHEFGEDGMPMRSFLRMPITSQLQKFLEKSGAFTPEALAEVVKMGSLLPWMEKIGISAEAVVQEAFETGGFGFWQPSNMNFKKNHQTLVETKQLRESITSVVK